MFRAGELRQVRVMGDWPSMLVVVENLVRKILVWMTAESFGPFRVKLLKVFALGLGTERSELSE